MGDRIIETLPAKKYYGKHATGTVVLVNGNPTHLDSVKEAKEFVESLEKRGGERKSASPLPGF